MPLHLQANITQEWVVTGIRYKPLNSSGEELQPLMCRNEKTLVNRDFSPRNLHCHNRIALALLKTQLVISEHAISSIKNEIEDFSVVAMDEKLMVALGLLLTSK